MLSELEICYLSCIKCLRRILLMQSDIVICFNFLREELILLISVFIQGHNTVISTMATDFFYVSWILQSFSEIFQFVRSWFIHIILTLNATYAVLPVVWNGLFIQFKPWFFTFSWIIARLHCCVYIACYAVEDSCKMIVILNHSAALFNKDFKGCLEYFR